MSTKFIHPYIITIKTIVPIETGGYQELSHVSCVYPDEYAKILPLINAIKAFSPYEITQVVGHGETTQRLISDNYPMGDLGRQDNSRYKTARELYDFPHKTFDLFERLLPYSSCGIRRIASLFVDGEVDCDGKTS